MSSHSSTILKTNKMGSGPKKMTNCTRQPVLFGRKITDRYYLHFERSCVWYVGHELTFVDIDRCEHNQTSLIILTISDLQLKSSSTGDVPVVEYGVIRCERRNQEIRSSSNMDSAFLR